LPAGFFFVRLISVWNYEVDASSAVSRNDTIIDIGAKQHAGQFPHYEKRFANMKRPPATLSRPFPF